MAPPTGPPDGWSVRAAPSPRSSRPGPQARRRYPTMLSLPGCPLQTGRHPGLTLSKAACRRRPCAASAPDLPCGGSGGEEAVADAGGCLAVVQGGELGRETLVGIAVGDG